MLVFEVLGALGEGRSDAVVAYERALDAYFARRFADALELLAAHEADDGPSRTLAERCRVLLAKPLPDDWDGVFVAKSK
jgi:adenylate cyclase